MQKLSIEPGKSIIHNDVNYLITKVLDLNSVIAVNSDGLPVKLPIKEILPSNGNHPPKFSTDFELLSDSDWKIAQERFSIIRPILEDRGNGAIVEEVAQKTKTHKATLYRWIERFEYTGLVSSLSPSERSGGRGKSRLDEEIELIINACIKEVYLTTQRKPIGKTILEVLTKCRNAKIDPPHVNTIRNRISQITEYERLKLRFGKKAAEEVFSPIKGSFPGADFPLAVVQIDHTKLDIILVDEIHRRPVGRPWITLAIDVHSRMVVGFYISFDPPGAMGTGNCIANSILPKDNLLIKYDLDSEWPCWGVMRTIHLDNAKEFKGTMIRTACKQYGIELNFRPVKTPNYGGHIERLLGTFKDEIHALPGTTFSNIVERKNYDSEKRASLSLSELEKWLITYISKIYHCRIHNGILTTPLAKYKEGIFGTKEIKGIGLPPRIIDDQKLKLDFTPFVQRSVQDYGVQINKIKYYSDVLKKWINSIELGSKKNKIKRQFIFKMDPRDIRFIYFLDPDLKEYFQIPYRDTSKPGMSIWEYREVINKLKNDGKKEVNEDDIFEAYGKMKEIELIAIQKTKKVKKKTLRNLERKLENNFRERSSYDDLELTINNDSIKPFEEIEYGSSK